MSGVASYALGRLVELDRTKGRWNKPNVLVTLALQAIMQADMTLRSHDIGL